MSFKVIDRTEEQLNQLARDTVAEKIFWAGFIPEEQVKHLLPMIFMPLAFMDKPESEEMDKVGDIFEYISEAGPRSINGYPMFFSLNVLSRHDHPLFIAKLKKLHEAINGAL